MRKKPNPQKAKVEKKRGPKPVVIDPAEVEKLASNLMYKYEIAAHLGIAVSTYMEKEAENAEISAAYRRGRLKTKQWALTTMMKQAQLMNRGEDLKWVVTRVEQMEARENRAQLKREPTMADIKRIALDEIAALEQRKSSGLNLTPEQANTMERLTRVLLAIEKDERERYANDRLKELSDDDLKQLMLTLIPVQRGDGRILE